MFAKKLPEFANLVASAEQYSQDAPWMDAAVLVAKNVPIWLAQCSRLYEQPVAKLSEIPDQELQELADRGFNVIWLVGLWERSAISKKIKRQIGLQEAEASAYSIRKYAVAEEWGGEEALVALRRRAGQYGIRLGADMVPNHTAMDAEWMAEYPELYLSTDKSPYRQYSFTGQNLSDDPRYEIYLEDHYLDKSDAAVVFKRVDGETDHVRFIYHGNDGILTPWNDTAQLDFSNAETRAKVIAEMLRIAKQFSLLRLDAAMLLTSQHIQRLWFPPRGETSHIHSRQKHRLSERAFQKMVPREFWQEAIEELNQEAPDTLLLAEAYWMLENFFAHSLGTHRVYNIDFMRLLGHGKNAQFTKNVKRILAYDPRLLQRRANFLSNPDEEAAAYSFGKGDRFFCLSTLLATLPGLPIFAHGQVEGYQERYAMDIFKPYLDELPDQTLISEHADKIAPLLKRRNLFGSVENFHLYDFMGRRGKLHPEVICFSNRNEDKRVLVCANNSAAKVNGKIQDSVPQAVGGFVESYSLVENLDLLEGTNWKAEDFQFGKTVQLDTKKINRQGFKLRLKPYETKILWNFSQDM